MQNTASGEPGETPTDEEMEMVAALYAIMLHAKQEPFTTKSDVARYAANEIALLASEGLLSTKLGNGSYCNLWMVTEDGMGWMEEVQDVLAPRH